MKTPTKFFCLLLFLLGTIQIEAKEDYSTMSSAELNTAFILALEKQRSDKVEELIDAGANVHTPIVFTSTSGDCDWMRMETPFIYAVLHNCPKIVKILLPFEEELNKALDLAIKNGYSAVVDELIKSGADINYVYNKDTPLITAVKYARATSEFSLNKQTRTESRWLYRQKIIQTLLEAGANVNHVNQDGRTALMEAVIKHDLNTVKKLLQNPEMHTGSFCCFGTKPINYADKEGNTALILAIQYVRCSYRGSKGYNICKNSQDIIKLLMETPGIDVHHANKNDETALALIEKLHQEKGLAE